MTRNLLLFIAVFALNTATAQKNYKFKNEYKPEKKYKAETTTTATSVTDFSGNEEILGNLRKSGVQMPMTNSGTNHMPSQIITGKRQKNGDLPVMFHYGNVTNKVIMDTETITEESPFSNIKVEGKYDKLNNLSLGIVFGEKVTPEIEKAIKLTLHSAIHAVSFPEKPMKIGHKFSREIPLSLPMLGSAPIGINIQTNYILKEIIGDKAIFSIAQTLKFDLAQGDVIMSATGNGDGIMEFNISDHYVTSCKSNMAINMSTTMDENMKMILKSVTATETIITMQ